MVVADEQVLCTVIRVKGTALVDAARPFLVAILASLRETAGAF